MKPTAAKGTFPYPHRTLAEMDALRPENRIQWEVLKPCQCAYCKREKAA